MKEVTRGEQPEQAAMPMKIGLVGWGVETKSAYRYFGPANSFVIGNEEPRDDFPDAENVEIHALEQKRNPGLVGNVPDLSYLDYYDDCELVIYQGATRKNLEKKFPEDHPFWQKAKTTLHILFEKSPTTNIVGVTGTKGKGTTTTLIYEMLKAKSENAFLGGNIGIPVLDFLGELSADSWVVLELSNFQLYKFPYSPHIAVHLMMMPEHIDEWHKTMEDYVLAKRNICSHQTTKDFVIYLPSNDYSFDNAQSSSGTRIPYTTSPGARIDGDGYLVINNELICNRSEFKLLGAHNEENICAAVSATWQVHHDIPAIRTVVKSFSGLEHRLELAGEIDGVKYYDDSFGTTPDTALVAMNAFEQPKIMIIGGHDKGNPMEQMTARLAASDIKHVIFIGTTGASLREMAISQGLDAKKTTFKSDGNSWTMPEIIDTARALAQPDDIVLLSTGSASFGLFKDYKDRGIQFQEAVKKLLK